MFISNWEDAAGLGEEQKETIEAGGYYTNVVLPGLRMLAYNSNYGWVHLFNILHTVNCYGIGNVHKVILFLNIQSSTLQDCLQSNL